MELFEQVEGLVSGKLGVIKTIVSMIKLEARLAGLSVFPLLLNVCLLLIVFITLWLSTMLLLGYVATFVFDNPLFAFFVVFLLNIALLFGLLKYLAFNLKKLSFEKTRAYFSTKVSDEDDPLEKTIKCENCDDGKNTTTSAR